MLKLDAAESAEPQIEQDGAFQHRWWTIQRVAWGVFCAGILAALLGLCGSGGLSQRTAALPDSSLRVNYDRFARLDTATEVRIHIRLRPGQSSARLWINNAYLDAMGAHRFSPEPDHAEASGDGTLFTLRACPADLPRDAEFRLALQPERSGSAAGRLRLEDGSELQIQQWVYP